MQHWQALGYAPADEMVEIARVAEEVGFEGLLLSDHVFVPEERRSKYPYTSSGEPDFPNAAPFPESFVLMGVLAQHTTRLRFATNVYILPLRHRSQFDDGQARWCPRARWVSAHLARPPAHNHGGAAR